MQYELLTHRGMQPDIDMDLKALLYIYSRYRKDREEAAGRPLLNGSVPRR